ncbi:sensor histidine kinase [Frigoriflavimonas asaccharolytica]|uniref:Signal transduction histidine kinase/ligand-binding sensor domain-containing protein n=1 Tax=Frigoriflavimonas asaccharolytica TaxID=2735899 RepID=A0A8J8KAI5_9FLAO|nr:sensor histidine kinase [Frigoriflavimonas asaccharolytica]NRS91519.1 signal transduction histidine kinase/ligand-binding sensor domain-containing protein [Frigoriflavimonas asaccharolytica]
MKYLFYFYILFFGQNFYAQNYNLTNSFSTKDGLPSNLVYQCLLDDEGFIWVATDNGISRFDGKRFINYTTKNGLPSNDVIQIIKQKDGSIWAICYKQAPSYFDVKLNQFVCLEKDKTVADVSNSLFNAIYPIRDNELFFMSNAGSFTVKDKYIENRKRLSKNQNNLSFYLKNQFVETIYTEKKVNNRKTTESKFYINNKHIGTIKEEFTDDVINSYFNNNSIYRFSPHKICKFNVKSIKNFQIEITNKKIEQSVKWFQFSKTKLSITCNDGTILIYDENTLKLLSIIKNKYNVNTAFVDDQNNVWIATLNNGLMYYTHKTIKKVNYAAKDITNFLCAKMSDDGKLYAGNYQGEIYMKDGKTEKQYFFNHTFKNNLWIRNIHFFPDKTIVVSDIGLNINFKKTLAILNDAKSTLNLKSSAKLNNETLILGTIAGLMKYDIATEKYSLLNFPKQRILNIKRKNNQIFYFSANDGLYEYDIISNQYQLIIPNILLQNDRIQYFEAGDNLGIWISTYKGNLYLVKNKKILKKFIGDPRIPINISYLLCIKNKLWIASKTGITILNFKNKADADITKLTTSDGLSSNTINFLDVKNDTVYAATDVGISKIPERNYHYRYRLFPKLIELKINGKVVSLANNFKLKSDQNNNSLELAGVDISGHFKNFQYSVNDSNFLNISGNFLNLKLNNGTTLLKIRAVDENNEIHQSEIQLKFEIQTPFFQSILFWSLLTFLFSGLLFMYYNRRKLEKQKIAFEKQLALEHQRNEITANLHDDLGASLSSLQINSAIAQKYLDKNPTEVKKILEKIEAQAKNISENIGDIIWSLKPSNDEFMSVSTRIKNITSEILGNADIHYGLLLDGSVDSEIKDFATRKNIILICKEAFNNILKHAHPNEVCVTLQKIEGNYVLEIEDDGIGFSEAAKKGNGIDNMKKRAEELGGTFELINHDGTKIIVSIPIIREKK